MAMLHFAAVAALCIALVSCQDLPYTYPEQALSDTTSLYFGLMQSFGGTYNGSGSIPGVELALDNINNNQELLPGYTLRYVLRDSFCERTTALESLHRLLFEEPVKIAIMGSGCSPATEPTAEIDHYYNLTHISCVSSSIALSNRTRYRAYYQMLPSEADIAAAFYGAIREYDWRHIAIIIQNENILSLTVATLMDMLQSSNVTITTSQRTFETRDGIAGLNGDIFDPNARIFLIATFSSHARDIICKAHKEGFRYPKYMFLTYAWYPPQWWNNPDTPNATFPCDGEDRIEVLDLTLAFLHFPFVRFVGLNKPTNVMLTGEEYMTAVDTTHSGRPPLYLNVIEGSAFCHDATWSLAKALSNVMNELKVNDTLQEEAALASDLDGANFTLENFTYTNNVIQTAIFNQLADTNFIGVTGEVKFKEGTRDVEALRVLQIRRTSTGGYDWEKIATVMIDNANFTYIDGESEASVWPEGVPYDGVPRKETVTIHPSLTAIITVLVLVGLVFSVVCIVFNIVFRKKKLIRLSSPNLNYVICIGAIILYLGMILLVIPSTDQTVVTVLCNLNPWFTAVGYSLCYGTILVKMFRVYFIYSNPSPRKKNTKIIKDEFLILMVLCMVAIDVVILLCYTVVEGSRGNLEARLVRNAENKEDVEGAQGITTQFYAYVCDSLGRKIFLGVLYGYKSILQILSLFLAFATRRVKVKGLNDTKAVAGAVYVTSITFTVLFVCTYSVLQYINAYAAIFCVAFFIGTTTILALLYIPKMVTLYKDPEGATVFRKQEMTVATSSASDRATIETLRRRVRELETATTTNSTRPDSSHSVQHLIPPTNNSRRVSISSDISLEMNNGKEQKTIWDKSGPEGEGPNDDKVVKNGGTEKSETTEL